MPRRAAGFGFRVSVFGFRVAGFGSQARAPRLVQCATRGIPPPERHRRPRAPPRRDEARETALVVGGAVPLCYIYAPPTLYMSWPGPLPCSLHTRPGPLPCSSHTSAPIPPCLHRCTKAAVIIFPGGEGGSNVCLPMESFLVISPNHAWSTPGQTAHPRLGASCSLCARVCLRCHTGQCHSGAGAVPEGGTWGCARGTIQGPS